MNTWRNLINEHLNENGESFADVVFNTLSESDLDKEFFAGYGSSAGKEFTMWTKNRVYFPVVYDGSEWVGSAPRNPSEEVTSHQGGQ